MILNSTQLNSMKLEIFSAAAAAAAVAAAAAAAHAAAAAAAAAAAEYHTHRTDERSPHGIYCC